MTAPVSRTPREQVTLPRLPHPFCHTGNEGFDLRENGMSGH